MLQGCGAQTAKNKARANETVKSVTAEAARGVLRVGCVDNRRGNACKLSQVDSRAKRAVINTKPRENDLPAGRRSGLPSRLAGRQTPRQGGPGPAHCPTRSAARSEGQRPSLAESARVCCSFAGRGQHTCGQDGSGGRRHVVHPAWLDPQCPHPRARRPAPPPSLPDVAGGTAGSPTFTG